MRGRELQDALQELGGNFKAKAIPSAGRYVHEPAGADESGVTYVPPFKTGLALKASVGVAAAILGFFVVKGLNKL